MSIIIKPIVTEKANDLAETNNRYGFFVKPSANKIEIAKAVSEFYGVTVKKVWTQRCPVQRVSRYTKAGFVQGKKNLQKKAFVQLAEGEIIDFYTNV